MTQHSSPDTVQALAKFAKWALQTGPFDGCELDGGDVQAKAIELGLIVPSEQRQDWWVYSPGLIAALSAPAQCAPDGWRLVPYEPTQDMLDRVTSSEGYEPWTDKIMRKTYQDMLDAAPALITSTDSEGCQTCMGSGYSNHPDSGEVCQACKGQGEVTAFTSHEPSPQATETPHD